MSTAETFGRSAVAEPGAALSATGKPLTKRGEATRRKLLEAAEEVFADLGYHEASIVKITERAGIGLGTFYLYFDSKQQIFEELVVDLNRRVRHSMSEAMAGASGRIEAERAGFEGFFRFTAAQVGVEADRLGESLGEAVRGLDDGRVLVLKSLCCLVRRVSLLGRHDQTLERCDPGSRGLHL